MSSIGVRLIDPAGRELVLVDDWRGVSRGTLIVEDTPGWPSPVGVRGDLVDRLGDGVVPVQSAREPRQLTIKGWASWGRGHDADVVRQALTLTGLFPEGPSGLGLCMITRGGLTVQCEVQPDPDGQATVTVVEHLGRLEFSIPLLAPDPCMYGPARSYQTMTPGADLGLIFPIFDDLAGVTTGMLEFGGTDVAQPAAWNLGNAYAYPLYTVTGDLPGGFRLSGGGLWVEWPGPVTPQAPVTVDTAAGTVMQHGINQAWRLTAAKWAGVPPNGATVPQLRALAGGAGTLTVTIRDTYL